jgi:FkbM family methyltransferase
MVKSRIDTKYAIPPDLNSKSVVISGGGFVGEWDYYMMKTYDCHLHIFEPFPENFEQLVELFRGKDKVGLHEVALFNKDGFYPLHLIEKDNGHSLHDRSHDRIVVSTMQVRCVRLKTFIEDKLNIDIDFLKLNVEGAEVEILQDIDKELAKKIKWICFSSHESKITTEEKHQATLQHLRNIGYEVKSYNPVEWCGPDGYFNRWVCKYVGYVEEDCAYIPGME